MYVWGSMCEGENATHYIYINKLLFVIYVCICLYFLSLIGFSR